MGYYFCWNGLCCKSRLLINFLFFFSLYWFGLPRWTFARQEKDNSYMNLHITIQIYDLSFPQECFYNMKKHSSIQPTSITCKSHFSGRADRKVLTMCFFFSFEINEILECFIWSALSCIFMNFRGSAWGNTWKSLLDYRCFLTQVWIVHLHSSFWVAFESLFVFGQVWKEKRLWNGESNRRMIWHFILFLQPVYTFLFTIQWSAV